MVEDTTQFIDAESNYRNPKDDDMTIRFIVMSFIKHINLLACNEFRGGYWKQNQTLIGNTSMNTETYIEDNREKYCNAIIQLYFLIRAEAEYRKKGHVWVPKFDDAITNIELARTRCLESTNAKDKEVLTLDFYKDAHDRQIIDEYKQLKVRMHQQLFLVIMGFLKTIDYFQKQVQIDGIDLITV